MQNIFEKISNFIPSIEVNKEIKDGKHMPFFEPSFPFILNLLRFKHDHYLTPNYHDYLEIGYIVEGTGLLNVEDRKYKLYKNDIIILSHFETHTFPPTKNNFMDLIAIYFLPELVYSPAGLNIDFEYLKSFYHRNNDFSNIIKSNQIDSQTLFKLFESIYRLLISKPSSFKLKIKNNLLEILVIINEYYAKNFNCENYKNYSKKIKDLERLKNLIIFLQKEFNRDITLREAADIANMSKHYFCKFFKKVIGKTFTNYLLSIRIDKAKELLLTENISNTRIAYEVGFENLSYFYRSFKEFTGFCPSEYVKNIKES